MRREYNIYPSLLNAYQSLLDYEIVAEEPWNKVGESTQQRGEYLDREVGDYKLTPDEMYLKLEADLIDSINRIDGVFSEAAEKGTAFNEIVDCIIENRKSSREDCKIWSGTTEVGEAVINAEINGFSFQFDTRLCKEVAAKFPKALTQYMAKADMETSYGTVHLYGYIDEWIDNRIIDIKTTSSYSFGKFERGWQKEVYPWCVIEAGDATEVDSFTYYVVEWAYQRQGEPIRAKGIYEEVYTYNHEESGRRLREMLESFIDWLESRREFIQDKRIFGGANPEGWHGQPVDIEKLEKTIFKTA